MSFNINNPIYPMGSVPMGDSGEKLNDLPPQLQKIGEFIPLIENRPYSIECIPGIERPKGDLFFKDPLVLIRPRVLLGMQLAMTYANIVEVSFRQLTSRIDRRVYTIDENFLPFQCSTQDSFAEDAHKLTRIHWYLRKNLPTRQNDLRGLTHFHPAWAAYPSVKDEVQMDYFREKIFTGPDDYWIQGITVPGGIYFLVFDRSEGLRFRNVRWEVLKDDLDSIPEDFANRVKLEFRTRVQWELKIQPQYQVEQ